MESEDRPYRASMPLGELFAKGVVVYGWGPDSLPRERGARLWAVVVVHDRGQIERVADCGKGTMPLRAAPVTLVLVQEPGTYELDMGTHGAEHHAGGRCPGHGHLPHYFAQRPRCSSGTWRSSGLALPLCHRPRLPERCRPACPVRRSKALGGDHPPGFIWPVTETARTLADQYWEYQLENHHFVNLSRGDLSRLEQWDDLSVEGISASREACLDFVRRAGEVNAEGVTDRVLAETVAAVAYMNATVGVWWPELQAASLQAGLLTALLPALHLQPLVTAEHGKRYLEKLGRFPEMVDQLVARLGQGAATGIVPLSLHVRQTLGKLDQVLTRPAEDDPVATQPPPTELGPVEAERWQSALVEAIETGMRPGLARFATTLGDVTLSAGRPEDRPGLCHLPGGDAVYRDMIGGHTTLDLDPETIHQLGLERVKLLEDEYQRIAGPLLGNPRSLRDLPPPARRSRVAIRQFGRSCG